MVAIGVAAGILSAYVLLRGPDLSGHPIVIAGHDLVAVGFDEIPGWHEDDPRAAYVAFRLSCTKLAGSTGTPLSPACEAAATAGDLADPAAARAFFEGAFRAYRIEPADGEGLLTAYYEPVVAGARRPTGEFDVPLYALPEDHVVVTDANRPDGFDESLSAARENKDGFEPWPTRGEIEDGALGDFARPLVYVADPVDAFFIHIQGSTRIALPDGTTMRVGFAGRNGHPYTSVGKVMRERGIRPEGGLSMDGMRAFFADNPELGRELMRENRSFIFFREIEGLDESLGPVGAQGVPLTPQRSVAVDPAFHALGTPLFVSAELPAGGTFRHLVTAQDTGSAIKGAARADLFWGTGPQAGSLAGAVKAAGTFHVLLPR